MYQCPACAVLCENIEDGFTKDGVPSYLATRGYWKCLNCLRFVKPIVLPTPNAAPPEAA